MIMRTVVILGASDKPERYSNKAFRLLREKGYRAVPVNPSFDMLDEIPVVHSLSEVPRNPDVLTIYLNPLRSAELADDILALGPKTVIFNPGTENPELDRRLRKAGIRTVNACSVVLLTTDRFDSVS